MSAVNLNRPSITRGPVTEADLDALVHSKREPGPQTSKASPETWRATDLILYAAVALFAVLGAVHIVAGAVAQ